MDCFVFWSTYRKSISSVRIAFRYSDSCSEGACPRKGSPFTIDYCRKFDNLTSALSFLSELNSQSDCYIKTILGNR